MPRTRRFQIVDSVNPGQNILDTRYNLHNLRTMIDTGANLDEKNMKVLQFCARWGLIANSKNCNAPCAQPMSFIKNANQAEGYIVNTYLLLNTYTVIIKYKSISVEVH